jgi:hypothetical protein
MKKNIIMMLLAATVWLLLACATYTCPTYSKVVPKEPVKEIPV